MIEKDSIAFASRLAQVTSTQVHAYADGGSVEAMFGAMEPPTAVIVPEMVVFTSRFLTSGKSGLLGMHGCCRSEELRHHELGKAKRPF